MKWRNLRKAIALVRKNGALSILDVEDDVFIEKDDAWASRKPSKRVLHGDCRLVCRRGPNIRPWAQLPQVANIPAAAIVITAVASQPRAVSHGVKVN